jgi:two-component system NarL family sensor kinase
VLCRDTAAVAVEELNALLEIQSARIADVLHDDVSQVLASAHVVLDEVAESVPGPLQLRVLHVRRHLHDVAEQLRQVSRRLHPAIVDDLGVADAIRYTARAFTRQHGVPVKLVVDVESCPAATGSLVYRVVQEGLANIAQHAAATSASISVLGDRSRIVCTIEDDGVGFDASRHARDGSDRLGLRLVRARIEAAGGSLDVVSVIGGGTRLRAVVPMEN